MDKNDLIEQMHVASKSELLKIKRAVSLLKIYDRGELRLTETGMLPVYFEGDLYDTEDLDNAEVVRGLERYHRLEASVIRDAYGRMWLSSMFDDDVYDWRVVKAWIMVNGLDDAEDYHEKHPIIRQESDCRAPYFYTESLRFLKFVKPLTEGMTTDEEFIHIVEHTKII